MFIFKNVKIEGKAKHLQLVLAVVMGIMCFSWIISFLDKAGPVGDDGIIYAELTKFFIPGTQSYITSLLGFSYISYHAPLILFTGINIHPFLIINTLMLIILSFSVSELAERIKKNTGHFAGILTVLTPGVYAFTRASFYDFHILGIIWAIILFLKIGCEDKSGIYLAAMITAFVVSIKSASLLYLLFPGLLTAIHLIKNKRGKDIVFGAIISIFFFMFLTSITLPSIIEHQVSLVENHFTRFNPFFYPEAIRDFLLGPVLIIVGAYGLIRVLKKNRRYAGILFMSSVIPMILLNLIAPYNNAPRYILPIIPIFALIMAYKSSKRATLYISIFMVFSILVTVFFPCSMLSGVLLPGIKTKYCDERYLYNTAFERYDYGFYTIIWNDLRASQIEDMLSPYRGSFLKVCTDNDFIMHFMRKILLFNNITDELDVTTISIDDKDCNIMVSKEHMLEKYLGNMTYFQGDGEVNVTYHFTAQG